MKRNYYIDTKGYSLEKFKHSLQRRDLIPSRVILKEKLDERFAVLSANGIKNLKELIDTLKTKPKIEDFSTVSNLPIDYLTILKREASSYLPNPVKLRNFPGTDIKTIQPLEDIGINNTKQLFNITRTQKERDQLSRQTGISKEKLSELIALSDLARLYGVGPVFARIIFDVGVNSVETFLTYSAEEFIRIYEAKAKKKADFGTNDINFSLELAKDLMAI